MEPPTPLESALEIFLLTYSRSCYLDNTLRQLAMSPFARCRLTVFDNCSTDSTPEITEKYRDKFLNYHVVRHNRNIGWVFSYLRAIELSTSLYTWILCDNDEYDFTHAEPLIEAIENRSFDHFYVASRSQAQLAWSGCGGVGSQQLLSEGAQYYKAFLYWPALIFRTECYNLFCSTNVSYLFPSFKFINLILEHNHYIYVSEYPLVIRNEKYNSGYSSLTLYRECMANLALIENMALRRLMIEKWIEKGFSRTIALWIALDKANKVDGLLNKIVDILFTVTPMLRIKLVLLLPLLVLPIPKALLINNDEKGYMEESAPLN